MLKSKVTTSMKTLLINGTAIATLLLIAAPAIAQVENATGIADPSRAGEALLNIDKLPDLSEQIEIKPATMQKAPSGAQGIKFNLKTLEIEGVGAYGAEDLDGLYKDKLGKVISLNDVYIIAKNITNKYRNDGYILTQVVVPPQTIEGGIVKLRVVEGFIDQIKIEGEERGSAVRQIRKYAENLRDNGILNAKDLERYLLLINDLAGVSARSILSPSQTTTGASDLTIIIERKNYDAEISINNHGSRYLGPYQVLFSGSANSRLGLNERISGQLVVSGDKNNSDELLFGSLAYEQPISKLGTKVRVLGSITSTEPGSNLNEFDVKGLSKFLSATISHPFIRSRTTNVSARASFDLRNIDSRNDIETSRHDRIRSLRIGTTVQFMDTIGSVGINALDLEISQGVDMFGASSKGQSNLTRSSGDPKYTKAELQLQRLQRLAPKVNLLFAGYGQWSATPLLSSEEFGVGGFDIGRGYDSSEIVGDDGISGKIELQWRQPRKVKYISDYQLFTFLDAGRVWDQDATTSANKRESIVSTGFGIRADITDETKAGFGVSFPLTRALDVTGDRDPRYYFNITHKF